MGVMRLVKFTVSVNEDSTDSFLYLDVVVLVYAHASSSGWTWACSWPARVFSRIISRRGQLSLRARNSQRSGSGDTASEVIKLGS